MDLKSIAEGFQKGWTHPITKGVIVSVALATIAALVLGAFWWSGGSGPLDFASIDIGRIVCLAGAGSASLLIALGALDLGQRIERNANTAREQ